jgi:hypothetical protein
MRYPVGCLVQMNLHCGEPTMIPQPKRYRWLGIAFCSLGLAALVLGFAPQMRSHTNLEDYVSWYVSGIGVSLICVGVVLVLRQHTRPLVLLLIAVVSPFIAFQLFVAVVWTAIVLAPHGPAEAVLIETGYQQISEARQIDDLFGPAWHFTSNFQSPTVGQWFSEALFGGRYELTMYVDIECDQDGVTKTIGAPHFILQEVTSVKGNLVSYGKSYEFGADKWQQVVRANGDFGKIGISLQLNDPAPGFAEYVKQPRNGIQMKSAGK